MVGISVAGGCRWFFLVVVDFLVMVVIAATMLGINFDGNIRLESLT